MPNGGLSFVAEARRFSHSRMARAVFTWLTGIKHIRRNVAAPAKTMPFHDRLEWNYGRHSKAFHQMSVLDWLSAQLLLLRARFRPDPA
jgi:hypothetical protein